MRLLALLLAILAVSVWWHPLSVPVQCGFLIALACSCMAFRSADKRRRDAVEAAAILDKALHAETRNPAAADPAERG